MEMTKEYTTNHYDDPKLSRNAELELPMDPGEGMGMFFGLEVLDANQYRVEKTGSFKKIIITGEGEGDAGAKADTASHPEGKTNSKKEKEFTRKDSAATKSQEGSSETNDSSEPKKKKRKKKKKDKTKNIGEEGESSTEDLSPKASQEQEPVTQDQLTKIRTSWSKASGGAHLHDRLLESLHRLGFASPTPIQAATLSASTMGRRNLVGAAPTGSGKTLAFLLPILNSMLQKTDEDPEDESLKKVQALIVTPTRGKSIITD